MHNFIQGTIFCSSAPPCMNFLKVVVREVLLRAFCKLVCSNGLLLLVGGL